MVKISVPGIALMIMMISSCLSFDFNCPYNLDLSKERECVYDVSFEDSHKDEYIIIARPTLPISINCLPAHIASILNDHIVECGEAAPKYLRVKHAY